MHFSQAHFSSDLQDKQSLARSWFESLQDQLITLFETIEGEGDSVLYPSASGRFEKRPWRRDLGEQGEDRGGGVMGMMRGRVFEKVGIHTSTVYGYFSEEFRAQIRGADQSNGAFWASGISLIAHPLNPFMPTVHMNTRMIATSESWFGGGADLTPLLAGARHDNHPDAQSFHAGLKVCCDRHDPSYYETYKAECDRYFHLAHRNEPRGIGGIFYDHLNSGNWAADFAFTQDVGRSFADIYAKIARTHLNTSWGEEEREAQLIQRGRYVEFNLLYDRGTTFGLKTGGNVESILSSMPPIVKWP